MQQSSATPSLHLDFWGLRKIVACSPSSSQCLLVSTVFGTVSSLHPISFLMIFILVYIRAIDMAAYYTELPAKTWVSPSKGTKLLLYRKDHVRSKLRPFYAKIIVCRSSNLTVRRLKKKKQQKLRFLPDFRI